MTISRLPMRLLGTVNPAHRRDHLLVLRVNEPEDFFRFTQVNAYRGSIDPFRLQTRIIHHHPPQAGSRSMDYVPAGSVRSGPRPAPGPGIQPKGRKGPVPEQLSGGRPPARLPCRSWYMGTPFFPDFLTCYTQFYIIKATPTGVN